MKRKRFKKLMMAQGMQRNEAEFICDLTAYLNQHPDVLEEAFEDRAVKIPKEEKSIG